MNETPLAYKRHYFDPPLRQQLPRAHFLAAAAGDRRDGSVYVYTEQIILAVNVALATRRPLLLRGPSGSGKSSLARCAARFLRRKYYEEVVTSRTQARDFLWTFDTLRRLNDAHSGEGLRVEAAYVRPGPLWWTFQPETACWRGSEEKDRCSPDLPKGIEKLDDPGLYEVEGETHSKPLKGAVVLIDEIDKADPDVPNNLLVPLGSWQFEMQEAGARSQLVALVEAEEPPLIVITTNDERELPNAFLRRCIIFPLQAPDENRLVEIATAQLGEDTKNIYREIARMIAPPGGDGATIPPDWPSTAEYLDALRCCQQLAVTPSEKPADWEAIKSVTLTKKRGASAA